MCSYVHFVNKITFCSLSLRIINCLFVIVNYNPFTVIFFTNSTFFKLYAFVGEGFEQVEAEGIMADYSRRVMRLGPARKWFSY